MSISSWLNKNIHQDFTGKNIVITGSSSGIGFSLAMILASRRAHVFLSGRSEERCLQAKEKILSQYPEAKIDILTVDLSSFESIDSFVTEIHNQKLDIDAFINNAGVFHLPLSYNQNHFELVMMTNYLGMKYLNDHLLPYLISLSHPVDVVFTTSVVAKTGKLDYDDFFSLQKYSKDIAYANSKLCCLHYFQWCLKQYQGSNLSFYLTHPGATYTPLIEKAYSKPLLILAKPFMKVFFHSPKKASLGILLALERRKNGSYYVPRGLGEFTGYPKERKLPNKLVKDYEKTIVVSEELIKERKLDA